MTKQQDIIDRFMDFQSEFRRNNRFEPNIIYLGFDEMFQLKRLLSREGMKGTPDMISGLKIIEVNRKNHMQVSVLND